MKILNISPFPVLDLSQGAETHTFSCLTRLVTGNQVTLLCPPCKSGERQPWENFSLVDVLPARKRKYFSFSTLRWILRLHKRHDKTIIDYPWFGLYLVPLRVLFGKHYEVRELDIQFLRFRGFRKWYWPLVYVFEYLVCRLSDRLRCISAHDMEAAKRYFKIRADRCIVEAFIPDARRFYPSEEYRSRIREHLGIAGDEVFILFYGKLSYKPNLEAVRLIKEELIPRLNRYEGFRYRVVIVGLNPPRIPDPRFIYTGFVRFIEQYVQSCDVMINPVILGGGVKTKVLEALACGKPVVSTESGARGIERELYKGRLFVCGDTDWEAFATKVASFSFTLKITKNPLDFLNDEKEDIYTDDDLKIKY